jgi:hypothetical protein
MLNCWEVSSVDLRALFKQLIGYDNLEASLANSEVGDPCRRE